MWRIFFLKMKLPNLKSGYSLIEVLIYIAIFIVLVVLVVNSFIVVVSTFDETRTNKDLLEGGNTSMERIGREIRLANSVTAGSSTFGSHPGVLVLDGGDASGAPRVIKFIVENGDLNIYENDVLIGPITGQNVQVSSLVFRNVSTSLSDSVKIELTLQDLRGKARKTKNFYSTVTLRGGY